MRSTPSPGSLPNLAFITVIVITSLRQKLALSFPSAFFCASDRLSVSSVLPITLRQKVVSEAFEQIKLSKTEAIILVAALSTIMSPRYFPRLQIWLLECSGPRVIFHESVPVACAIASLSIVNSNEKFTKSKPGPNFKTKIKIIKIASKSANFWYLIGAE